MSNRDGPEGRLTIYLNDHLAGATAGWELARRVAREHRDAEHRKRLTRVAADIAADREALLQLMRSSGVPIRNYKIVAGWLVEKAGRLKPNTNFLARSLLSDLIELEALYLGIQGKAAGWRVLLATTTEDGAAMDQDKLRALLDRAGDQLAVVEELRIQAGARLFSHA